MPGFIPMKPLTMALRNAPNPTVDKVVLLSRYSVGGGTKKEANAATSQIRVHYKIFGKRLSLEMTVKTKDITEEPYRDWSKAGKRQCKIQYVLNFKRR